MIRERPKLLTDIRDFITLFLRHIFRRKFFEWLESSIESDLGMRFAMWSLDLFAILLSVSTVTVDMSPKTKTKFLYP